MHHALSSGLWPDLADASPCYLVRVDALRAADILEAQTTTAGEKLRQALELMELGIELQRRKLRAAAPDASADEIEERLSTWMSAPR